MRVKKEKCYVIRSKKGKYVQGAFPFTEEGKIQAEKYLKKINKNKEYEIIEA